MKGNDKKARAKQAAEDAKQANPAIKYLKDSMPDWMRRPQAKSAFDVALFGVTCFVIIKFGK